MAFCVNNNCPAEPTKVAVIEGYRYDFCAEDAPEESVEVEVFEALLPLATALVEAVKKK